MARFLKILFSIPKTIYFNLRYLPFCQAIKLPVWIATNVRVRNMYRGGIKLESFSIGKVRIGYHEADGVDVYGVHTIIDIFTGGILWIKNDAHIGQGAIICVKKDATLEVGSHFAISGTTSIICTQAITIGNDVQMSWNSLVMDSDAHQVFGEDGRWINPPQRIRIGNKVWIAANVSIMKGALIGDNVVVSSNSLVNKHFDEGSCIIGGIPAKKLRTISGFKI